MRRSVGARAAVEHGAPQREGGDADAGARAPAEPRGDVLRVEAEAAKRGEGRADRQRELRARAEPGMGRDRLLDVKRIGLGEAEALGDGGEVAKRSLALGA